MKAERDPAESSARISPTAHYTGYTWLAHGLSHPAFATATGRFLYRALAPANKAMAAAGQATLDGLLLARHQLIDALLRRGITEGRIGQVIEVACGLSPRGYRFAREHGDRITYIEADLPSMAARKRALLARTGAGGPGHRVVAIDATADDGPLSLAAIARDLDPGRGLAIITEGLLNYFDPASVAKMWRRFAGVLGQFPTGLYLSDLHLGQDTGRLERLFAGLLGVFVRGRIHFHFHDLAAAVGELSAAGFADAQLRNPEEHQALTGPLDAQSARMVRIVEAWTRPAS
ncbi:MAG TPA: class I SAM-dependent methyltransferase [Kofleriaceae bacterium]|jgi:O-methyltransferase involved in polyketide biosynthesis|nr:class I SAM-dependent methyltransferase [Kofleriaceae bacterium]